MKLTVFYLTLLLAILSACRSTGTTQPTSFELLASSTNTTTPPSGVFTVIAPGIDTPVILTKTPTTTPPPPTPTLSPQKIAESILKDLNIGKEQKPSPNGMCVWERLLGTADTDAASDKYNNQIFEYVTVSCGPEPKKFVIVDEWAEGGLGYSLPAMLGWSVDEKYLYFDDTVIPDGCQPLGGYQNNLHRVTLSNGEILSIPTNLVQDMTLSPSTDAVVFSDPQTKEVGIYDLISSTEKRTPIKLPDGLEYWQAGNFTWSPDEQKVVFIVQYGDPCVPTTNSLRQLDPTTNQIITLLEKENQAITINEWKDPNRVLISIDDKEYWLDPVSGNIILAPECQGDCVITRP